MGEQFLVWWEEKPILEKEKELLRAWGFTILQAKVYLALIRIRDKVSAGTLSSLLKMPRTDVYRVLSELQEEGFVEKMIARPTTFKAVPLRQAFLIMTERRTEKTAELQIKAQELIQLLESRRPEKIGQEGQFKIISRGQTLLFNVKNEINNSKKGIDFIFNWTAFPNVIYLISEEIEHALKRNVKIRCLVDKPEDAEWCENEQLLMKYKSLKLRAIPHSPITRLGLYDGKKVFIASYLTADAGGSTALSSTNKGLIAIVQSYFNSLWEKAH
jgi:sugar-specific transcriptional regulator TrmB